MTALMNAVLHQNADWRQLIDAGADTNAQDAVRFICCIAIARVCAKTLQYIVFALALIKLHFFCFRARCFLSFPTSL